MLGPASFLQIWDGNWGAHAEIIGPGGVVGDIVALPQVVYESSSTAQKGKMRECVYQAPGLSETPFTLPTTFTLHVIRIAKDAATTPQLDARYGSTLDSRLRFRSVGTFDSASRASVRALVDGIALSAGSIRQMTWSGGRAVWIDHKVGTERRSLVFGPPWGAAEWLTVELREPANAAQWVEAQITAMDEPMVCAQEVREIIG
ncbi:MAG TPA: hypothetical protein PKA64_23045 [Myxococcota bacterium]|nr:hypothetical protein [Myxococcota bacterium]